MTAVVAVDGASDSQGGAAADRELVRRLVRREPAAWESLVDLHGGFLSAVARRACAGNAARADDAMGEVFLALLKDDCRVLRGFCAPYNLRALLAVIVRRAASRGGGSRVLATEAAAARGYENPASEVAEQRERGEVLSRAVARLPEREQTCIRLAFEEGLTQREIAERAGMPVNSVGKTVARALDRLRRSVPQTT